VSKRISLLALALVGLAAATATISTAADARAQAKSPIFQDCAPGAPCPFGPGGADFSGPFGFGSVTYRQDAATGALTLRVKLRDAAPNTTYSVHFTCSGTSHQEIACAFRLLGTLTTNKQGNGKSDRFTVPLENLHAVSPSPGHVDIANVLGGGGWFVAGGIHWVD
jgi:hypothetical protein